MTRLTRILVALMLAGSATTMTGCLSACVPSVPADTACIAG